MTTCPMCNTSRADDGEQWCPSCELAAASKEYRALGRNPDPGSIVRGHRRKVITRLEAAQERVKKLKP